MPLTMTRRILAFAFAIAPVAIAIHVANPAQEQLPLIARPGVPFEWTLRPDTFSPQPASLATSNMPSWLAFDVASLTFSGLPPVDEHLAGPLEPVSLLATALDGQTARDEVVLYISTKPAPVVLHSIASQLRPDAPPLSSVFLLRPGSALANSSDENGLRVPPGWSFSIGWRHDTFAFPAPHDEDDLNYTARLSNGLSLPGWLVYNTSAFTFSGVAPKLGSPSSFAITLYGGDAPGYRAIEEAFVLTVAAHEFSLSQASIDSLLVPVNASANSPLLADLPTPMLLLDGEPLSEADAGNVTFSLDTDPTSGWLHLDSLSLRLNGTPPHDYVGQLNIPLLITAPALSQTIRAQVSVVVHPSVFTVPRLPLIWVKPGKKLSFDISKYIVSNVGSGVRDDALVMQTDSADHAGWLLFDSSRRMLEGQAPSVEGRLEATFLATDPITHAVSQASLRIAVSKDKPADSEADGVQPFDKSDKDNGIDTPNTTSSSGNNSKGNNKSPGTFPRSLIALVVGMILACIVLCLIAACLRRFCAAREDIESNSSSNAIHHIDFDAVRRASREADRIKSGKVARSEKVGWAVVSLFGAGKKYEREKPPGIAVIMRTNTRKAIDGDSVVDPRMAGRDEGWTCVPRDAGLTDDEKRARGYPVGSPVELAQRKKSLLARVLDRPWREDSVTHPVAAPASQHTRMVTLPGDSPGGFAVSHTVDSFRALNRQARDGSLSSLTSGGFVGYEQPTRLAGSFGDSSITGVGHKTFDLDPHELVSSSSGSSGSSSGLVGSPNSVPRQRIQSPLARSQPYAHSDLRTSPPESFDSVSTTMGTGLAMSKPAEERRMFNAPTYSNGSIRTAGGSATYDSPPFDDFYEEDGSPGSGSGGSASGRSGSAASSRPGTGSANGAFDELPTGDVDRAGSTSRLGLLSVPGTAMGGAPQIPQQAFSTVTPVLGTQPAFTVRSKEDLRLVSKVSRSASADTAPRIPPIAKHRQSMSLSYGPDAHVAANVAVVTRPLHVNKILPQAPTLLPAHDTYSGAPGPVSQPASAPLNRGVALVSVQRDNRDTLGIPAGRTHQRESALSYLTTSSTYDEEDPDSERTEAARRALTMGRGTTTAS